MITLFLTFSKLFFNLCTSKKLLICENAMLKKELQILQRKETMKAKICTSHQDRMFFTFLQVVANIKDHISIVKPETVLKWQRLIIKNNWKQALRK